MGVVADEDPAGAAVPEPVVAEEELADVDDAGVVEPAALELDALELALEAGAEADEVAVAEWLVVVCEADAECDLARCERCLAPDEVVFGAGELPLLSSSSRITARAIAPRATAGRI